MGQQQDTASNSGGATMSDVRRALGALSWGNGLTRDQIRRRWPALPHSIYLHLLASKRYRSAREVLHDVAIAASRAEGEFLGPNPDLPEGESQGDGGPPGWGPDPIFTPGGYVDSGSAEDRTPEDLGDS